MKLSLFHPSLLLLLLEPASAQDASVVTTITSPPSIPSDEPSYSRFSSFTSAMLNSSNTYREQHNASSLSWNSTLEDFARDYLDDMSSDSCEFEHSEGPYGENLAIGYQNATGAVEAWGEERDEYDFGDGGFDEETGHFTQLVWKDTTDVGCARKLCDERGWYVVCEYWPRGNVQEQFEEQVVDDGDEDDVAGALPRPRMCTMLVVAVFSILLRL